VARLTAAAGCADPSAVAEMLVRRRDAALRAELDYRAAAAVRH
jgi:hypothetical protein